ncbi:MAG TPA: PfkB family carbohydrate kinase [Candidatus Limnocylindria bacterium]|nr:PfkB family carbohydrate kinase [Candidatus Limnocylindria bacterium]
MPPAPPPSWPAQTDPVDLLLVGGLTIDRFADGSLQPGGAVLHAARAARAAGCRVGIVSVAGPEPVGRAGVAELLDISVFALVADAPQTPAFRHREGRVGRRLWLEPGGAGVRMAPGAQLPMQAHAVLFAPVFDELPDASLGWGGAALRGACLQGWLRRTEAGGAIAPLELASLHDSTVSRLATFDALFASDEDVSADRGTPERQLDALRTRLGPGPLLVLTLGADGAWFDIDRPQGTRARWHMAAPTRIDDVATTGAGDAFAALFLASYDGALSRDGVSDAAAQAMSGVVRMLEKRRR